jgi:UDP-N-acetyl-D-glucosamine dehydrogenase
VDIHRVIEACNSQHFSHIHQPGVSVGGHCIPVYPHLYLNGDSGASIVSAARTANKAMPKHLVDRVELELASLQNKKIIVLGLSYRPESRNQRSLERGIWSVLSPPKEELL